MSDAAKNIWLTQEAYDRLAAEHEELAGAVREEISKRIAAARDEGDLKENGGYHAAREEQAKNEARIRELRYKLDNATIGTPPDDGVVEEGMVVTASVAGNKMTFLLGPRELAASADHEVYSIESPLGKAINKHSVGDEVSYLAPNGKQIKVKLLEAKPFEG